jgi:hypothetical protein
MKKNILIPIILSLILIPFLVFGAWTYHRTPEGTEITSPITIHLTFDNYNEICVNNASHWGIYIVGDGEEGYELCGKLYSPSTKEITENFDIPIGKKISYIAIFCPVDNAQDYDCGSWVQADNPNPVALEDCTEQTPDYCFTIIKKGNFIFLPSNTIQQIKDEFNEVFQDLKPILPFIIGIWIGFWVVENVIAYFSVKREKW